MSAPAVDESSASLSRVAARLVYRRAERLVSAFTRSKQSIALRSLQFSRLAELANLELSLETDADFSELSASLESIFPLEPALQEAVEQSTPVAPRLALRRLMAHALGQCLDVVRGIQNQGTRSGDRKAQRRASGSYFTPAAVAQSLVERSIEHCSQSVGSEALLHGRICDPAAGGGAFLIEAALALCERSEPCELTQVIDRLYGADLDELAIATTEVALYFLHGQVEVPLSRSAQFVVGNALLDETWRPLGFEKGQLPQFEWVLGNPPWVGFQGRAAQALEPELRAHYRAHYAAFRGYPSLQGLFVQRATQLSSGLISLLLPSSVSDLEGYRSARTCLRLSHQPAEPLLEYGQDAFAGVTQPCFGLVALATSNDSADSGSLRQSNPKRRELSDHERQRLGGAWCLEERSRAGAAAVTLEIPEVLKGFAQVPSLPSGTFRELGFQSNPRVREAMFQRMNQASDSYPEPLLEGRVVSEFQVRPARVYIREDHEVMKATRCRFRPLSDYESCPVLVRQTAAFPIAARSNGQRFRNSLIGGFETADLSADLLVALLNSSLYRALHVSRQRDARQATFPQVKLAHLRSLPMLPEEKQSTVEARELIALSVAISGRNELSSDDRIQLNCLTYRLFNLNESQALQIENYLKDRAPRALGL